MSNSRFPNQGRRQSRRSPPVHHTQGVTSHFENSQTMETISYSSSGQGKHKTTKTHSPASSMPVRKNITASKNKIPVNVPTEVLEKLSTMTKEEVDILVESVKQKDV